LNESADCVSCPVAPPTPSTPNTPQDSLVVTVMAPALTVDDEIGHVTVPMTTIRDSVQVSAPWRVEEGWG
jgi:hypothetical protein